MWLSAVLAGVFFWSWVNVLDSATVKRYPVTPVALMWVQSCFSTLFLALFYFVIRVPAPDIVWILLFSGSIAYAADLVFLTAIRHIDISVTNIAWSILAVFETIAGFWIFGERWGLGETLAAIFILASVTVLSLWHRQVGSTGKELLFLPLLASLYLPFYIIQKWALVRGVSFVEIFFWQMVGRELLSFVLGMGVPPFRRQVFASFPYWKSKYLILNALIIGCFLIGTGFGQLGYLLGPISLSGILTNLQPFVVLLLAGLLAYFVPTLAPRELLTLQSLRVKIVCFGLVFLGLALLAFHQ